MAPSHHHQHHRQLPNQRHSRTSVNMNNNHLQSATLKHIVCTALSVLISFLVLINSSGGANTFVMAAENVDQALKSLKVYSDIISEAVYTPVNVVLQGSPVKPGQGVSASKFKDLKPEEITWDADSNSRHTLILLDLDSGRTGSQPQNNNTGLTIYNQYTSINIQGNSINSGAAIVGYEPPRVPCAKSTKHRMLLLALVQPQLIDLPDVYSISAPSGQHSPKRENFKLKEFLTRHRYEIAAANVFLALGEVDGVCSSAASQTKLTMMNHLILALLATLGSISALRGSNIHQHLGRSN